MQCNTNTYHFHCKPFYIALDFDCKSYDDFFSSPSFLSLSFGAPFPSDFIFPFHSVLWLYIYTYFLFAFCNFMLWSVWFPFFFRRCFNIHFYYKLSSIHILACLGASNTGQTLKSQWHRTKKETKWKNVKKHDEPYGVQTSSIWVSLFKERHKKIKSLTCYSMGFI